MGSSISFGLTPPAVKIKEETKSALPTIPESTCEPGWYINPFDGKKKRTEENPTSEDVQDVQFGEASQPTTSNTTISAVQAAEIRAQVCHAM